MPRNYKKEYQNYHSKPEQRRNRSSRNKARRILKNLGRDIAGKDVDHSNGNPMDNRLSNLKPIAKSINRSKK